MKKKLKTDIIYQINMLSLTPSASKCSWKLNKLGASRAAKAVVYNSVQRTLVELLKPGHERLDDISHTSLLQLPGDFKKPQKIIYVILNGIPPSFLVESFPEDHVMEVKLHSGDLKSILKVEPPADRFIQSLNGLSNAQILLTPEVRKIFHIPSVLESPNEVVRVDDQLLVNLNQLPIPIFRKKHFYHSYEPASSLNWLPQRESQVFSLDCEMIDTSYSHDCYMIALVDEEGDAVIREIVKPQGKRDNWDDNLTNTRIKNVKLSVSNIRSILQDVLNPIDILLFHDYTSDLACLQITHPTVADTCRLLSELVQDTKYEFNLFTLAALLLNIAFQTGKTHDPYEDAVVTLLLFKLVERRGVEYFKFANGFRINKFRLDENYIEIKQELWQSKKDLRAFVLSSRSSFYTVQQGLEIYKSKLKESSSVSSTLSLSPPVKRMRLGEFEKEDDVVSLQDVLDDSDIQVLKDIHCEYQPRCHKRMQVLNFSQADELHKLVDHSLASPKLHLTIIHADVEQSLSADEVKRVISQLLAKISEFQDSMVCLLARGKEIAGKDATYSNPCYAKTGVIFKQFL